MHKSAITLSTLALSALLSGCVASGPNTEQGAVTGAVLGTIAGAIIGHNQPNGDAAGGAVLGGLAGAVAGGMIGNSVDQERGTHYGYPDQRGAYGYPDQRSAYGYPDQRGAYGRPDDRAYQVARVQTPPPPPPTPVETIPPSPGPNAVWVASYWVYDGRSYTWMSGHWEMPPPFARSYVAAHWEVRNGTNVYVPGYWQ